MKTLDAQATEQSLDFPRLIEALREAFRGKVEVPLRHTHAVGGGTSLIMPAWDESFYGVKIINVFPGNSARGLPGLHGTYVLFDARTGVPLLNIDGDVLTAHRTAAASALGASYLAREDASDLLIVGSGRVASLIAPAMSAVRNIRRVRVWSRTHDNAAALAKTLRGQGFDASAIRSLDDGYDADIISCATLSTDALIQGAKLEPGTHLDLIGSFKPDMREADGDCLARAAVFVDTDEAPAKSGDILSAVAEGNFSLDRIAASLTDLASGRHLGRKSHDEITLFKAVGNAREDLAGAELVYGKHTDPAAG